MSETLRDVSARVAVDGVIEINATSEGFAALADAVTRAREGSEWLLDKIDESVTPETARLRSLIFSDGSDRIRFDRREDQLIVAGSSSALEKLAKTVRAKTMWTAVEGARPPHSHLEYFPDHPLLAADSVAVVLGLTVE